MALPDIPSGFADILGGISGLLDPRFGQLLGGNMVNSLTTQTWTTTSDATTGDWFIWPNATDTTGGSITVQQPTQWLPQVQIRALPTPAPPIQSSPGTPFDMPAAFNRYLNASDLLERFIKFCGEQGVRQGQFMKLPIELFLNWLILEAAEADGEAAPEGVVLKLPVGQHRRRCETCGRFVARMKRIDWCGRNACYAVGMRQQLREQAA